MTYNSKKTITSMAAGVLLLIGYIIYALGPHAPAPQALNRWAGAILIFIGIGIAGVIIIQILFHIAYAIGIAAKEQHQSDKDVERILASTMVEDERDKLINFKAAHASQICAGLGFVAALAVLTFGGTALLGLHILLGAFSGGSLIEGAVSIHLYERGVHNG